MAKARKINPKGRATITAYAATGPYRFFRLSPGWAILRIFPEGATVYFVDHAVTVQISVVADNTISEKKARPENIVDYPKAGGSLGLLFLFQRWNGSGAEISLTPWETKSI